MNALVPLRRKIQRRYATSLCGPKMVITNLGCYEFTAGEMILTSLHPGCALGQVRNNTGWDIRISPDLRTTDEPTSEELRIIREELDPTHLYI